MIGTPRMAAARLAERRWRMRRLAEVGRIGPSTGIMKLGAYDDK